MRAASDTLCVESLSALAAVDAEILASTQVTWESYVAFQHHYGVSKRDARIGFRLPSSAASSPRSTAEPCSTPSPLVRPRPL